MDYKSDVLQLAFNQTLPHQLKPPDRIGMKAVNPSPNWEIFVFFLPALAEYEHPRPFSPNWAAVHAFCLLVLRRWSNRLEKQGC
jgi:hypothetical protein